MKAAVMASDARRLPVYEEHTLGRRAAAVRRTVMELYTDRTVRQEARLTTLFAVPTCPLEPVRRSAGPLVSNLRPLVTLI